MCIIKKIVLKPVLMMLLFYMLFVMACSNKKNIENFVQPPINGVDIPFQTFSVDPKVADTIHLDMGTQLIIPENAFVDSLENLVQDSVTLKYREFRDAAQIFLAGIPMNYNALGTNTALETAGMFEIKAISKKRELHLAYGKSIKIKMGSRVEGNDYNFFGFDESNGTWNFMGYPETQPNIEYKKTKERIKELSNKRKYPLGDEFFVFDYSAAYDVTYYQLGKDYGKSQIKKRIRKYGAELYNMYTYDRVQYRGRYFPAHFLLWKKLGETRLPNWVKSKRAATNLNKIAGNTYLLTVNLKNKTYKFKAEIEMPLKLLYAYSPDYLIKNYEEAMQQLEKEHERLESEAKVYRSFEMSRLGIANFDRLYVPMDAIYVIADYHVDFIENRELYTGGKIFMVPGSRKSYFTLNGFVDNRIAIDQSDTGLLMFTILPDNEIGIIDKANIDQLDFGELAAKNSPHVDLHFRKWGKKIEKEEDLMELFGL